MQLIDEILEYLQYHPMSSRQDVEGCLIMVRPFLSTGAIE